MDHVHRSGTIGQAAARTSGGGCVIRFGLEPVSLAGEDRVERMHLGRPGSKGTIALDCGLVVSSIGRRTAPLPGLYACGWSKRGPRGTIGTNRACGVETAEAVLAGLTALPTPAADAEVLLTRFALRKGQTLDHAAWRRIDAAERSRGQAAGKPREKFVTLGEMLAAADAAA
ncbi:MAG: hypothetical protein PGN25_19975 [Methylorubrum populi]